MKKNRGKGKLILFEGLDGAGKTVTIRAMLAKLSRSDIVYCKGMGSNSFFGRLARRFGKTIFFLLEQVGTTFFAIKPALRQGKIVFLDRYFFSVASHSRQLNKTLIALAEHFLVEPDLIFYFRVGREERIRRLKNLRFNRYHQMLLDFPTLIDERENNFAEILQPYREKTIKVSTDLEPVEKIAADLVIILEQRRLL
jgi:thymidylate kinase